jgi:hypothetical protein
VACRRPGRARARRSTPEPTQKAAPERLLRKLLRKQMRPPGVMVTDKLPRYAASKKDLLSGIEHRQHKRLNNRAENSHQPTRRRGRQMKGFKSAGRHNGFCPPMTGSTTSFISAAATFPLSSIEPHEPNTTVAFYVSGESALRRPDGPAARATRQ